MTKDVESASEVGSMQEAGASAIRDATAAKATRGGFHISDIIVNVRFLPNGLVNTITQKPEHLSPQDWFDYLCKAVPLAYRPLSGGRGTFTIEADDFTALRSALPQV